MKRAFVIGIVGAESSGKTRLAGWLQAQFVATALPATMVAETLREFCDRHHRTPRAHEQAAIAAEQTRRIAAAAAAHAVVVADTTALMTAIYSELVFADRSLYAMAEEAHRRCDLTLLTALDLPWQADGLQRDGAHVREPVDALIRAALQRIGQPFSVVSGHGEARRQSAWLAAQHALRLRQGEDAEGARNANRHRFCERCGDSACERHLLPRL